MLCLTAGVSGALRLAALAASRGGGGPEGIDAPEVVVMAVRRIRAERDELRRRDAKSRKQLNDARTTLKVGGLKAVSLCRYSLSPNPVIAAKRIKAKIVPLTNLCSL
jgi:hypothetical protein